MYWAVILKSSQGGVLTGYQNHHQEFHKILKEVIIILSPPKYQ